MVKYFYRKVKMKNFEKSKNKERERQEIITQKVPENIKDLYPIFSEIDKMPKGCAVIGGAARSLAFQMINKNVEKPIPIRDVDVAFFEDEISQEGADIYAKKFSPDDFAHEHKAQKIENVDEYMDSRDFTMNQIIYKDGELVMSRSAIRDIYKGVINPCEDRVHGYWDHGEEVNYENNDISTRLALKAVLQQTVLSEYVRGIKIQDGIYNRSLEMNEYYSYGGFQLALAIQKAFDYGENIPQKFLKNVLSGDVFRSDLSFLSDENDNVRNLYDTMTDLNESILKYPFDFRNAANEYYMRETSDKLYEEEMGKYEFFENYVDKNQNYRYR